MFNFSTPFRLNAAQIHPYTSLAWSVISAADQVRFLLDILTCAHYWVYSLPVARKPAES